MNTKLTAMQRAVLKDLWNRGGHSEATMTAQWAYPKNAVRRHVFYELVELGILRSNGFPHEYNMSREAAIAAFKS